MPCAAHEPEPVLPGSFDECNPELDSFTSFGCPDAPWCMYYPASNIFSLEDDKVRRDGTTNYWITEKDKKGPDQGFVLDLGCDKNAVGVNLKNIGNAAGAFNNVGTKKFREVFRPKRMSFTIKGAV